MSADVGVYFLRGKTRSQKIADALLIGARVAGFKAVLRSDGQYTRPREKIAAFYGFQGNLPKIMADYQETGRKVVFVDLGYWDRRHAGRFEGFHKVSIDARHPDKYLMKRNRDPSRLHRSRVRVQPWRPPGDHIIVAGMSDKSAKSYGLQPHEWERWAVAKIRKHTSRPIIYRPKPSWSAALPIPGSTFQPAPAPVDFTRCHAVVTHHSNLAIDALIHGTPAFCMDGAAKPMSLQDLAQIDEPWRPKGREQWLANLAWCQWTVREMRDGSMWENLKRDGLI